MFNMNMILGQLKSIESEIEYLSCGVEAASRELQTTLSTYIDVRRGYSKTTNFGKSKSFDKDERLRFWKLDQVFSKHVRLKECLLQAEHKRQRLLRSCQPHTSPNQTQSLISTHIEFDQYPPQCMNRNFQPHHNYQQPGLEYRQPGLGSRQARPFLGSYRPNGSYNQSHLNPKAQSYHSRSYSYDDRKRKPKPGVPPKTKSASQSPVPSFQYSVDSVFDQDQTSSMIPVIDSDNGRGDCCAEPGSPTSTTASQPIGSQVLTSAGSCADIKHEIHHLDTYASARLSVKYNPVRSRSVVGCNAGGRIVETVDECAPTLESRGRRHSTIS